MSDTGIVPDTWGYLVLAKQPTRGVTHEISTNYDWAIVCTDADNRGGWFKFLPRGNGYIVWSQGCNWGGYQGWKYTTSGIKQDTEANADVWTAESSGSGFRLRHATFTDKLISYSPAQSLRWLFAMEKEGLGSEFVTWQFQPA